MRSVMKDLIENGKYSFYYNSSSRIAADLTTIYVGTKGQIGKDSIVDLVEAEEVLLLLSDPVLPRRRSN